MNISPVIHAFWTSAAPDQRTESLDNDPLWRETVCEIPRQKIPGAQIGVTNATMYEQGTVFCPWCDDAPDGCKCAATPQRWAAYYAHLAGLKQHNERCNAERGRIEPLRRIEERVNAERRMIG